MTDGQFLARVGSVWLALSTIPAVIARCLIIDPFLPILGNWAWMWGIAFCIISGPGVMIAIILWFMFCWKPKIES